MTNVVRFAATCVISVVFATLSIASAEVYTSVDFPSAQFTTTESVNPERTSVGNYGATSGVVHGPGLKKGVFTSFDPRGSIFTMACRISSQGAIVGSYTASSSVSHSYILNRGKSTTAGL